MVSLLFSSNLPHSLDCDLNRRRAQREIQPHCGLDRFGNDYLGRRSRHFLHEYRRQVQSDNGLLGHNFFNQRARGPVAAYRSLDRFGNGYLGRIQRVFLLKFRRQIQSNNRFLVRN